MDHLMRRTPILIAASILAWGAAALRGEESPAAIVAGAGHGVLLKTDGTVWTWGDNTYGQLGRTGDDSRAPVEVAGLSGVRKIATGDEFTLALKADGTVWAWGKNEDGQLGNGSKNNSPKPAKVGGLPRITAIAACRSHAMALDESGTVWEWGAIPERSSLLIPKRVEKLTNVAAIAAGESHSVALDTTGQVWVWGDHGLGNLGDGNFISFYPQKVPGFSGFSAIAGAYHLTVGLKPDGTVWSVGYGEAGGRGNGTKQTSSDAVMVTGLTGVKAIAANYMNVLAIRSDGTVWGWGSDHYGQIGNTQLQLEDSAKPVRVGALTGVVAIACAGGHAAAVTGKGVVWTWGQNDRGALGADPEALKQSETPMRPGQAIPPECQRLFSCLTASGKYIQICGDQDLDHVDHWSSIHYRFGASSGPPDFMFPDDPENALPSLFFSEENHNREVFDVVRFSNGGYTYRVYNGERSGGGVEVQDANGKRLSSIACVERPEFYRDYLRMNLPCDPKSPGCKKSSGAGR